MMEGTPLSLLIEAGWKSLLVSGAALLLLALLKRRSAAERACAAHFGMLAVLLVPLLVVAGPRLEVEMLAPEAPAMAVPSPVRTQALSEPVAAAPAVPVAAEPAALPLDGETGFILYLVPAAILLLLTLIAILRLFALRGRASVIVEQGWLTAMAHAQRRMGIKHGTALLVSEELRSPVSWGVLRPIILLNEEALDQSADAEAIIAHELAHVARFDWLNLLVARIATAIIWFNPLVWLLARQGHQLREEAADDAVLRAEVPSADYAALLVGTARHEGKGMLLAAHGVAPGKGSLSLRVRRILEPTLRRGPARFAWGTSCAAGALLVAAPLAALTPVRPAPPLPSIDSAAVVPAPPQPVPMASAAASVAPSAPTVPALPPAAPQVLAGMPATATASNSTPAVSAAKVTVALAARQSPQGPAPAVSGTTDTSGSDLVAVYPSLRGMDADDLVTMRVHHVTPAQLREYAALGYGRLNAGRIIEWAVHGVTPAYIRSLATVGYSNVSPEQLTAMRIFDVTPRFIRDLQATGIRNLSTQRLVELKVHGGGPRRASPVPESPARQGRPAPSG